jgi:hypothetical protein
MALLKNLATGAALPVAARLVVGRATTATLRLPDKRVSGEHATLRYTGAGWEIRDLGSRNGTFVDGLKLGPGEAAELKVGSRLSFGDPAPEYELVDDSAPGAVAREMRTGQVLAAKDGLLGLPSAERPEILVFASSLGEWCAEMGEERREITDGDVIEAGGQSFALSLPAATEGTLTVAAQARLETVTLKFAVSRDEEHVRITIVHRTGAVPLEPREHGYVLLTLARKRLEDKGLPLSEQGWIDRDRLLKMLQLDPNGLNVAIYRARGQLAAAGIEDAVGIVEVRRGQRRIGITADRLEIGPL